MEKQRFSPRRRRCILPHLRQEIRLVGLRRVHLPQKTAVSKRPVTFLGLRVAEDGERDRVAHWSSASFLPSFSSCRSLRIFSHARGLYLYGRSSLRALR